MRNNALRCLILLAAAAGIPRTAPAYEIDGGWPNGTIQMLLILDGQENTPALPSGGLADGADSWNNAVRPAFDEWNRHLERSQFSVSTATNANVDRNNGRNEVFFAPDVYGEPFGDRTLAVALSQAAGVNQVRFTESDVIFNSARSWDSYRGNLRTQVDIRRVALHEFGHVLGLNHPDEATPPQSVQAIMNSTIGNLDTLQADDIAAVSLIYDGSLTLPELTHDLASLSLQEGGSGELFFGLDGVLRPEETDIMKFAWFFRPTGGSQEALFTVHDGFIKLGSAQLDDAGSYTVVVETPLGEVRSNTITVSVSATAKSTATRLVNLSTRGTAGVGDQALIVGFAISGNTPRRVLVRGIGPSLTGVPDKVEDTTLSLTDSAGNTLGTNDDWEDAGNSLELQTAFAAAGAFTLPSGSRDSALIATLPPGTYTAAIRPGTGTPGIALVEAYDLDAATTGDSRLVNLSTRGFVGQDDRVLIAGFAVQGTGPRRYLLRAVGDSLADFGISGFLDDTTLDLFNAAGQLIRRTDDWDSPAFLQPTFRDIFEQVGATPFTDRQESAMLLTLNPGSYTLHLAGFEGQTGIALVEIYEVDP